MLTEWQKDDGWNVDATVVDQIEFHHVFTQIEDATEDVENTESE